MRRLMLLIAAVASAAVAAAAAGECESGLGCSLNGNCVGGRCSCHSGWGGARCGKLRLLPTTLESGYNRVLSDATASWGGSMVRADDSLWHSFVGEMTQHCGLSAFLTNDQIVHAVSKTPLGPCIRQGPLHPFGVATIVRHLFLGLQAYVRQRRAQLRLRSGLSSLVLGLIAKPARHFIQPRLLRATRLRHTTGAAKRGEETHCWGT